MLPGLLSTLAGFLFLAMFLWMSLAVPRRWRLLMALAYIPAVGIEYAYWTAFRRPLSAMDISTALNSPAGMWQNAVSLFFNPHMLLPAGLYLLYLLLPLRESDIRVRHFALALMVAAGVNGALQWSGLPANRGPAVLSSITPRRNGQFRICARCCVKSWPIPAPASQMGTLCSLSMRASARIISA